MKLEPDITEEQLRDLCRARGLPDTGAVEDMKFWLTAKVVQLKARCAELGLPVTGTKSVLIQRLANPEAVHKRRARSGRRVAAAAGGDSSLKAVDSQRWRWG